AQAILEQVADGGEVELDLGAEQTADEEIQQLQRDALRRLDQLLEALKPEVGLAMRPPPQEGEGPKPGGGGGRPPGGEGIPALAQLKALKALQQDVNDRTERFARRHPHPDKLTERQRADLQAIRTEQ